MTACQGEPYITPDVQAPSKKRGLTRRVDPIHVDLLSLARDLDAQDLTLPELAKRHGVSLGRLHKSCMQCAYDGMLLREPPSSRPELRDAWRLVNGLPPVPVPERGRFKGRPKHAWQAIRRLGLTKTRRLPKDKWSSIGSPEQMGLYEARMVMHRIRCADPGRKEKARLRRAKLIDMVSRGYTIKLAARGLGYEYDYARRIIRDAKVVRPPRSLGILPGEGIGPIRKRKITKLRKFKRTKLKRKRTQQKTLEQIPLPQSPTIKLSQLLKDDPDPTRDILPGARSQQEPLRNDDEPGSKKITARQRAAYEQRKKETAKKKRERERMIAKETRLERRARLAREKEEKEAKRKARAERAAKKNAGV